MMARKYAGQDRRNKRDIGIFTLWLLGAKMEYLAQLFGVTAQRVQQIIKKFRECTWVK